MENPKFTHEYFPASDKPEDDVAMAFRGIEEMLAIEPQTPDSAAQRERYEATLREFSVSALEELRRKIPEGKIIEKILDEKRKELPLAA